MLESMIVQMFLTVLTSFIKNPKAAFTYVDVLTHCRDGINVILDQLQVQK